MLLPAPIPILVPVELQAAVLRAGEAAAVEGLLDGFDGAAAVEGRLVGLRGVRGVEEGLPVGGAVHL